MIPVRRPDWERPAFWVLVMLSLVSMLCSCARVAVKPSARDARQAVLVTAPDWNTAAATLQRYERRETGTPWIAVGGPIPAVLGRNGLAWGRGLAAESPGEGPVKREGDGRSPAGVFVIRSAFGYAPADNVPWIRLPYRRSSAGLKCVDDPASPHYNRFVDTAVEAETWDSHEDMLRRDDLYRFGAVIGHNDDPPVAGAGSCIFLHVWRGPNRGTAGCTAVALPRLEEILRWLDPALFPILVQLVAEDRERLREAWDLP